MDDGGRPWWRDREAVLGGLLLLLGALVLASQALDLEVGQVGWPLFVVLPGLGLLGLGLTGGGGWLVATGLAAFVGFAVLFEAVIGIGDRSPGRASRSTLAVLLILSGLVLLGRRLLATRRPGGPA